MRNTVLLGGLGVLVAMWGCSSADVGPTDAPSPDGEYDSFNISKADGPAGGYEACQLREVLLVVNDTTDASFLRDVAKVHSRAADNIVKYRLGPDGKCGTGDDEIFDDLKELDDVSWVGKSALKALATYVEPRCSVSLANRSYMDSQTFSGFTGGGWTRDEIEMEATMTIKGISGPKLREGARFVLKQMEASMSTIAQLKGEDVVDELEDNGAPRGLEWVPAEHSKGKTALLILSDQI